MKRLTPLIAMLLMLVAPLSWAAGPDGHNFYLGGGFGSAKVAETTETQSALQLLVGYALISPAPNDSPGMHLALEAGYIDVSGGDPYDRYWGSAVLRRYLNSEIDLLLRLGVEEGDEQGLFTPLAALGVEYHSDSVLSVRMEVIERADSPVAMLGFICRP